MVLFQLQPCIVAWCLSGLRVGKDHWDQAHARFRKGTLCMLECSTAYNRESETYSHYQTVADSDRWRELHPKPPRESTPAKEASPHRDASPHPTQEAQQVPTRAQDSPSQHTEQEASGPCTNEEAQAAVHDEPQQHSWTGGENDDAPMTHDSTPGCSQQHRTSPPIGVHDEDVSVGGGSPEAIASAGETLEPYLLLMRMHPCKSLVPSH